MMSLKPCPFCGAKLICKEEVWRHPKTNLTRKYPVYTHPQKGCVLDYQRFHFYAQKLEAWNRRANNE